MDVLAHSGYPWTADRINAVVYARYSSHSQGEQSIEGQLEKAHAYAAAKGYRIVHEYVDRAQSGRTDKRDEFQQMLKDTAKKQFQVIILWKVDRFGRNREEIALNMKINRRAPSHKWSRADYILTDKLFCGKCGTGMVGECGTGKSGATYNYYICSNRKRFRSCDKKAVRQDWIEEIVLREIKKVLENDDLVEFIAENTFQYYMNQNSAEEELRAIRSKLTDVESAIANIIKAVEAGMFNPALKKRMDDLEEQRQSLLTASADIEITQSFKLTKEHILFFLLQFRDMDFSDRECQRRLVSTFVNAIYLYDDKIILTFNYSGDSRTVTLAEIDAVTEGEVFGCCAPWSAKKEQPPQRGGCSFLPSDRIRTHPMQHPGGVLLDAGSTASTPLVVSKSTNACVPAEGWLV